MTSLKLTRLVLRTCSAVQTQTRMFGVSASFCSYNNPLFLKNKFKIWRKDKQIIKDTELELQTPQKHGTRIRPAVRKPYIRPVIQPWRSYQEIPYHYREGANKALIIPKMKKRHIKKYKNKYEERPHYRSAFQRLLNRGRSLIPYDKKISAITGKHTGPGVEGGTELAQKLAALHSVQPTGYINRLGNFKQVKEMIPEFVVPKLEDFKLKPYVSYRATEINQSKFTARNLYSAFYGEEAKKKFEEETGITTNLELRPVEKKKPKWSPFKKAKD